MAERRRLLELALEGLKSGAEKIQREIAEIERELGGAWGAAGRRSLDGKRLTGRRGRRGRRFSAAQRKAQSERMRAIWARRKAAAAGGRGKRAKSA